MSKQKQQGNKKTRKQAGCFFSLAIPLSFVLITVIASLIVFLILRAEYKGWAERFENSHLSDDFTYLQDSEDIIEMIDEKIGEFSTSSEKTESLELTTHEVFWIFAEQFENAVPEKMSVYRGYIDSDYGSWSLYMQTKYNERILPWFVIHLEKEEEEGVDIKVSSISIGSFNITDFGMRGTIKEVNKGLSDAFLLVNQSDFTGRRFENIELEPEMMIIKGSK